MPVDWSKYPEGWKRLSSWVRFTRAGGQCEWKENGVRCEARHGEPNPITGSMVVLTTAHLDHDTTNNETSNLMAMCQMHHLRYDGPLHARNAAETRRQRQREAGQMALEVGE
jgi:hypothetical protein